MFNGQDTKAPWDPPTKLQLWVGAVEAFSGHRGVGSQEVGPFGYGGPVVCVLPEAWLLAEEVGASVSPSPSPLILPWESIFQLVNTREGAHYLSCPHGEEGVMGSS